MSRHCEYWNEQTVRDENSGAPYTCGMCSYSGGQCDDDLAAWRACALKKETRIPCAACLDNGLLRCLWQIPSEDPELYICRHCHDTYEGSVEAYSAIRDSLVETWKQQVAELDGQKLCQAAEDFIFHAKPSQAVGQLDYINRQITLAWRCSLEIVDKLHQFQDALIAASDAACCFESLESMGLELHSLVRRENICTQSGLEYNGAQATLDRFALLQKELGQISRDLSDCLFKASMIPQQQ